MATTLQIAVDEIYGALKTQWDALTPAIIGGSPPQIAPLLYEDTNWKGRPPTDLEIAWARVNIRHVTAEQATLSNGTGQKRFCNYGVVTVQCFAPMRDNTGAPVARQLAGVAKLAYQGVRTRNVWFRNVRFNEIGREGTWYQLNVVANFEWDEVS